jgi:fatty acid desaturase
VSEPSYYARESAELRRTLGRALPAEALRELHRPLPARHFLVLARQLVLLAASVTGSALLQRWFLWLPCSIVSGFVVFGFTVLLHEVVHEAVFDERRSAGNRVLGWVYAFPSGISCTQFTRWHLDHHAQLGDGDADPKRHHLSPKRNARWLKALYLTPALFFIYFRAAARETATYPAELQARIRRERLVTVVGQLSILAALIVLAGWWVAFKVYMVPYFLVFPVAFTLNRLGQHYAIDPADPAKWSTLMAPSWFWDMAFLWSGHHLEHHYFPRVPFYRLPELHALLGPFFAERGLTPMTYRSLLWQWFVKNQPPHARWSTKVGALVALIALTALTACEPKVGDDSLKALLRPGALVSAVRFLPDGTHLACASSDGVIRVWDWASGQQTHLLSTPGNSTELASLAVGPGGQTLLSGNEAGKVFLWDLPHQSLLLQWQAHARAVHGVDVSLAATGSDDGTVKLWELPSGREVRTLTGHGSWVGRVRFSPDGTQLLSASADASLRIWDVQTGQPAELLQGHAAWVRSGVFVGDGAQVLSGGYDQSLRLWDAHTGKALRTLPADRGMVYEVTASPDGKWALSTNSDASLSLWDLAAGEQAHVYHTEWSPHISSSCGDLSPDGDFAAAGDWNGLVYVWDVRPAREAWAKKKGP